MSNKNNIYKKSAFYKNKTKQKLRKTFRKGGFINAYLITTILYYK